MSSVLEEIAAKTAAGGRLSANEARALEAMTDIVSLGMVADEARRKRHGDRVTFVRVADIPIEHVESSLEGLQAPETENFFAGELRLIGAPESLDRAVAAVRRVAAASTGIPLSGFSLADLEALAERHRIDLLSVLERLREAGLELIAEAPLDRLKDPRSDLSAPQALQALQSTLRAGLPVARLTVHSGSDSDRVAALMQARALQGAWGGFRAFAPLPRLLAAQPSAGYDDVKQVALARLLVDNIESIQVDWALYGPKLAQVALTFGVNDVDAVPARDDQSRGRRRAPLEEIRRNIQAASFIPVERNGRFETMTR